MLIKNINNRIRRIYFLFVIKTEKMKSKYILIFFLIGLVFILLGGLFSILHLAIWKLTGSLLNLIGISITIFSILLLILKLIVIKDFKNFWN